MDAKGKLDFSFTLDFGDAIECLRVRVDHFVHSCSLGRNLADLYGGRGKIISYIKIIVLIFNGEDVE